jgi:hypothetical protein
MFVQLWNSQYWECLYFEIFNFNIPQFDIQTEKNNRKYSAKNARKLHLYITCMRNAYIKHIYNIQQSCAKSFFDFEYLREYEAQIRTARNLV